MAEGREPVPLAMIVSDSMAVDPLTRKKTLIGLFSGFVAKEFPLTVSGMAVHVALTECQGKVPLELKMVDANEERDPVFTAVGEMEVNDPLMVVELDFRLGEFIIPEPGDYRVQLFSGGSWITQRRLTASLRSDPKEEKGDDHEQ